MVREVSPAKPSRSSRLSEDEALRPDNVNVPKSRGPSAVFGQPTKIESPLGRALNDVFIKPKNRPEHHRSEVQSSEFRSGNEMFTWLIFVDHPHLHAVKDGAKKVLESFRTHQEDNHR